MPKHTTITKAAADRFKAKTGRVDPSTPPTQAWLGVCPIPVARPGPTSSA